MKKALHIIIVLLLVTLTITTLVGCSRGEAVSGTGTVKYIDLEGGFYGIVGDDNKHYDPMNLDQTYQQDGLRVRFQARIRQDISSIHMWGTIIEITKIEKIE
jgi:inhibitor of cysteine peptidase